jgi:hypothetical protein
MPFLQASRRSKHGFGGRIAWTEKTMHSNRNIRNAQQLRSLIQNMGRSIDEARNKRLGPSAPQAPAAPTRSNDAASRPGLPAPQPHTPAASTSSNPGVAPPIRNAHEMFTDGTPRLKARPKRPS